MAEKTVRIPSISCGHCVMTIKREIGALEGVTSVEGDENTKMVTIRWENPATWEGIAATIREVSHQVD